MKLSLARRSLAGLTRLDVVAVIGVVGILTFIALGLSALRGASDMAKGINCVGNLKDVGLALRIFATDHDQQWPWNVPISEGGSARPTQNPELLWRHFLVLSNELGSPKRLWCPKDSSKRLAEAFHLTPTNRDAVLFAGNQHVSYFLALNANTNDLRGGAADEILAGDRNLTVEGQPVTAGKSTLGEGQTISFNRRTLHRLYGQLLFADGSVEQVGSLQLAGRSPGWPSATNLLLIP